MRRGPYAVVLSVLLGLCLAGVGGASAKALALVLDVGPNRANEAQAIAAQLNQVGINAQVRVWQTSVLQPQIISGQRAMYMTVWGARTSIPSTSPCRSW